jgi:N-acetylglucosaminyl-diphospho-decaprenol L-rhamnosyltransferase
VAIDLSYCVVNNDGRDYLLDCLAAIERHGVPGIGTEVLVLDNASTDGSAEAVREKFPEVELVALEAKQGKAANDSLLMERARGEFCLLLNEDTELKPGCAEALYRTMKVEPTAGAAGAQLFDAEDNPYACAWRFPGVATAFVGALFLHRRFTVQSTGTVPKQVDWVQSSAMMVRREAAAEIGFMDPQFFVYYDECDFCRRLADAGWDTLYVPFAEAFHHNQLSNDLTSGLPRIVEFHRNRDLYMRKHHNRLAAMAVRVMTSWTYALRALASLVIPGAPTKAYRAHARQALFPYRGRGLKEKAGQPQA